MYKLHLPIYDTENGDGDDIRDIRKIKKLLTEILGYTISECNKMESDHFCCVVAKDLTEEQAKLIIQPFCDNDITLYLEDNETDKLLGYQDIGGVPKRSPKSHYYDKPIVSREHLIDPFAPKPIPEPVHFNSNPTITCPYCHSNNTKKITTTAKVVNTALFGWFGTKRLKEWHCNNCKSDF